MNFLASIRKELMEQWRTYRFLVLAAVLVIFGLLSPLAAKFTPQIITLIPGGEEISKIIPAPTLLDAIAQYVKNVGQFGILLAIFLTMGAVNQEKERGTAAMMLVKPLPRGSFLLAKFAGLSLSFLGCLALAALGAYYYTLILFSPPDFGGWLALNGLMFLYLEVYIAITLLLSTLLRSQAAAVGLSFGVLLVLGIIGSFGTLGQYLPGQLVNWGAELMAGGKGTYWTALGVSLGLIAASLLAAWLVFKRQEI
jgi:ABC-2 type transport system permease protein